MLILVAVTINISKDGGLFSKARTAKSGTAYEAEEENLAMYMYGEGVYDATTGEINLEKLKENLEKSGEWGKVTIDGTKLTVLGKQSGKQHIINEDGTTGEKKDEEDINIIGTYYLGGAGDQRLNFKNDGQVTMEFYWFDSTTGKMEKEDYYYETGTYTYNKYKRTGTIVGTYVSEGHQESVQYTFNLIKIDNDLLIELIDDIWKDINVYTKEKGKRIIDLGTSVYTNGTKTIEFSTGVENGIETGMYVVKENGNIWNSEEGEYICYEGKLNIGGEQLLISEDLLTITWNDEIYTKQQ